LILAIYTFMTINISKLMQFRNIRDYQQTRFIVRYILANLSGTI